MYMCRSNVRSTCTDMYVYPVLGTQGQAADPLEQLVPQPFMTDVGKHTIYFFSVLLGNLRGVEGDGGERCRIDDGHGAVLFLLVDVGDGGGVEGEVADGGSGWR